MIRFVSKFVLFSCLSSAFLVPLVSAEESWSFQWEPSRLANGSPVIFQVAAPVHLRSLSGKWLDHEIYFAFDPRMKKWYGIAGVSLETKEGIYPVQLIGITSRGTQVSFERKITVGSASYPSIAVTVPKQFTEPSAEQLQKVAEDKALKQDVFGRVNPLREWSGKFVAPANARTSDVFGTQRTFNGQVQSTHQGLDYAVPQGTPVAALNSGTVLVARPMFFEGNCVVLDHGQGLLTIYMHLSEFKVKEGEHVTRGEIVGLSGGTGRATGPHLHVAVRWEGIYLDPAILLKLSVQ
jgi:murein DD-endopeptidase MepM/ murein hydrolase activator NlpD